MLELIFSFLGIIYLLIAFQLFAAWLKLLNQDFNCSSTEKSLSIAMLITIATFWPLCLPFAYLELLNKKNLENKPAHSKPEMFVTSNSIVLFSD
ncbi:MAG: hypothetical protein WBA93_13325 [Microcoleaceae cyanobacterium]